MNATQQEAQQSLKNLLNRQQLFPPSPEELRCAIGVILPVLGPKRRGVRPREDQLSIEELTS
jgi:hypothetical protein